MMRLAAIAIYVVGIAVRIWKTLKRYTVAAPL